MEAELILREREEIVLLPRLRLPERGEHHISAVLRLHGHDAHTLAEICQLH